MKKLSFLLSFVLVISLVSPAWASASKELAPFLKYDYTYDRGVNNPIYTNTNALLIEDLNAQFDYVYGRAYDFDIVKIDQNKQVKKISFKNGLNRFAQYNGKSYVLNYNYNNNQLEIFDENLNYIKSISVPSHLMGSVEYAQHENYISYISTDYDEETEEYVNNVVIIDLETLQLATNIELPPSMIEGYYFDESINLVDALGQNKLSIPTNELDAVLTAHYDNGYVYVISRDMDDDFKTYFMKATLDGKVVQKEKLNIDGYYEQTVIGDFIFYETQTFEDYSTVTFSYNIKTGKLDQTPRKHLQVYPLNEQLYLEAIKYPSSNTTAVTVKKMNGQTVSSYNTEGFWIELSEKYIIAMSGTETITKNKVYDAITGTLVGEISHSNEKYNDFVFVGQDKLYEYEFKYEGYPTFDSSTFGSLYIMNPEPIKPNPNAVAATKAWTIAFTTEVDANTVNNSNVYVTDASGNKVTQQVKVEGKKIIIQAPVNGYTAGSYVLHVEGGITSTTGKVLKAGQTKAFDVQ